MTRSSPTAGAAPGIAGAESRRGSGGHDERDGHDGLRGAALLLAAVSIYIGIICATLDMAILQNALPALTREMRMESSASVWIITLYMLVTLTMLLPLAPLSDRIGYRRIFLAGIVVFVFASFGCGLASTTAELLAGRFVQGLGAAAMMGSSTSLIRIVYPKALIARAVGANSAVVATSFAAAPSLSAAILLHLSWHWLFWINVPLGTVALACGYRFLPPTRGQIPAPRDTAAREMWRATFATIDWWSVALNVAFFSLLLLGTEDMGRRPGEGAAMLAIAAIFGGLFVKREVSHTHPMLPFDLLGHRRFALTIATSFCSFASQGAAFVALPFYLQTTLHYDAKRTAMILTAWPVALALMAPIASRLSSRVPVGRLCAVGQAMTGVGLAAIVVHLVPLDAARLAAVLAFCGAGFGLFQAPNNYVIVSSAPPASSGAVGALRAATRIAGQLLGSALAGLAFLLGRPTTGAAATAVMSGPLLGVAVAAALAIVAGVFSITRSNDAPD